MAKGFEERAHPHTSNNNSIGDGQLLLRPSGRRGRRRTAATPRQAIRANTTLLQIAIADGVVVDATEAMAEVVTIVHRVMMRRAAQAAVATTRVTSSATIATRWGTT